MATKKQSDHTSKEAKSSSSSMEQPCPEQTQALGDGHKFSVQSPEWAAAQTIAWILYTKQFYSSERAIDLVPTLAANAAQVRNGSLIEAERILLSQAEVLQALFNRTLGLAALMMDNPEKCDRYASLALRAQEQCRKTLLTLAELKNPKKPTQFIKNYVDKQLNQLKVDQSEDVTENPSSTQPKTLSQQSLEASPYAPLDTGSETTTEGTDSELETVEDINRPNNRRRKSCQ